MLKQLTPVLLLTFFMLPACGPAGDASGAVTRDDVVNVDDLLEDAGTGAGAIMVGEPAQYLGEAKNQIHQTNNVLRSALKLMKDVVGDRDPTAAGINKSGIGYAFWDLPVDTTKLRLLVVRVGPQRVRYLLAARPEAGAWKGIMTGIFIKRGPRVGGGRLHISLTNASDLFGDPNADGSIHMVFANHRADAHGRRIFYVNVKDRTDPNATKLNYAQDILFYPGVGGRFRGALVGDLIPGQGYASGTEAIAMRVLWKKDLGGRADVAVAHVAPAPAMLLGHAHECWDTAGARTAFANTWPEDDVDNPNSGDATDASLCGGFGKDDASETAASADGQDADPELDNLLAEAEADTVTEADADTAAPADQQ